MDGIDWLNGAQVRHGVVARHGHSFVVTFHVTAAVTSRIELIFVRIVPFARCDYVVPVKYQLDSFSK